MNDIPALDYPDLFGQTVLLLCVVFAVIRLAQWVECRLDAENHALWRASLRASALAVPDANLPDPCALCGAHAALVETITLFQTRPALGRVSYARMAGVCSSCATILTAVRAA